MSAARLDLVKQILTEETRSGRVTAASVLVARRGVIVLRGGWGLQTSSAWNAFGDLSSERTFGHSGASGTVAWADPERELLCVILNMRPWSQDKGFLLRRIANAVQGAIE